ncbi:MAG: glycoside hydrolase family 3 N-terminal domain-containing protein [Bacteroidota bacterium]
MMMNKNIKRLAVIFFLGVRAFSLLGQATPESEKEKRIEALIAQMTAEEKAGQLNFYVGETIVTGPTMHTAASTKFDDLIRQGKLTGLFNVHGAAYTARLQKIAVEQSRLKIPLLFGADVIHGFKTVTPIPLGEAASWDLSAIERSARLAAREATAAGINFNFAPMVDIARDPRWGRISEGAGEDPYLGSLIAAARVKGFQGAQLGDPTTVAVSVKHFAAYGAVEAGRDYNPADMSLRMLYETYLPPYKAAIDAGAATVMTSFNELDGIPATANKKLLTEILRKEWGFDGMVVSDYNSIGELIAHGVAATMPEATKLSLEAGTDMDMMSSAYLNDIPALIRSGTLDLKFVDDAVRRVLRLKFDLGLFDNPYLYSDEAREKAEIRSQQNLNIARDMARRSIVLLKNSNQLLPLNKNYKKIAVIGPLADNQEDMNGSWSFFGEAKHAVSILHGIKEHVRNDVNVLHHSGCDLYTNSKDKIREAVAVASQAEVVIMVVGESAVMNGEGASRADIGLPGIQEELVKEVVNTGIPVVVLLVNGRPMTLEWIHGHAHAIVETWTLGSEAGHAVADVLFGDYNPSGKLPVTFPRHVGQIPIYYNRKNTGRPYQGNYNEPSSQRIYQSKYRDVKNSPLYPFGYGLSYTTFEYSALTLSSDKINKEGKLEVTLTVANTGKYDGEEVVQLYIRDWVGSVTRPVKELKRFQKVFIKAGESKKISFTLTCNDLAFYRADMSWGAEPGMFDVFVGGSSETEMKKSF